MATEVTTSSDFIRTMIAEDMASDKYGGKVMTRFPPEPNGFLHIGHAKSICLNFGLASEYGGVCNLRFDDTNPTKEDVRYTESIMADVRWLGFDWDDRLYYASDYFERLYDFAVHIIRSGRAYVDSLNESEIREYRGTVTEAGRESPFRNRTVEENLDLFERMRKGEFPDGAHVLRAKIDMAASNMIMRDPLLYRIRHAHHYRTGDAWCLYPMYDFAHCLSDAIEGITHSLCTLEFKDNRALYDWVLKAADTPLPRPEQTEFARLAIDYTVLSKRKLIRLVEEGVVAGWDDPRMPTIAGLRRRGVTPEAIRNFCELIGVAKVDSRIDMEKLEFCIRDDLNRRAPRVMCVLDPIKVVIENYPEGKRETLEAAYYPHDVPKEGSRPVPFTRELFIERDDFREDPPKGYFRLAPGREVRLRYAYVIKCEDVVRDGAGNIVELRCTYDPATRSGSAPTGRKVKGTIHWVSATDSLLATVRLYDRLFKVPNPDDVPDGEDFMHHLNPNSIVTKTDARIEPSVAKDPTGSRYQFERQGYFISDMDDSNPDALVFNRTVELRDTWSRGEVQATASVSVAKSKPKPPVNTVRRDASERVKDREGDPALVEKFEYYRDTYMLSGDDADVLTRSWEIVRFFEAALAEHDDVPSIANWMVNEVVREAKGKSVEALPFDGRAVGRLVALVGAGTISGRIGKDVLAEMTRTGDEPEDIVKRLGLEQISDESALGDVVDRILGDHGDKVDAFRAGKTALQGFFLGEVMKETEGRANPAVVRRVLTDKLRG